MLFFRGDRRGIGTPSLAKVVMLADAVVGDIECAARKLGNLERPANQAEELAAGLDGFVGGTPVHVGNLAGLLVGAHERVDALGFRKHRIDQALCLVAVLVPQRHRHLGPHERPRIPVPLGLGRR